MTTLNFQVSTGNAVYTTGRGEPVIIIGGGPGLSSRAYRKFLAPLAETQPLVFWDYAGTGESIDRESISWAQDYQDLLAVIGHFESSTVKLFGHSYGGTLAIKYAAENPSKVSSLTLVASAPNFKDFFESSFERKARKLPPNEVQELAGIFQKGMSGPITETELRRLRTLESKCQMHGLPDEVHEKLGEESEFNISTFVRNRDWTSIDVSDLLPKIEAPTWIVTSKHDIIVPPAFSEPFKKIQNSWSYQFQNSAHWPFIEEPELFAREWRAFLKRI